MASQQPDEYYYSGDYDKAQGDKSAEYPDLPVGDYSGNFSFFVGKFEVSSSL